MPIERRPRHLRPGGWTPGQSNTSSEDEKAAGKDEAQRASGSSSPTLPVPATQAGKKADKKAAKEAKEFDGNEEGGKVRGADGKPYDQSLIWALQKTFFWPFWLCACALFSV